MRPGLRGDAFAPLLLACVVAHALLVCRQPRAYVADDALFYFQIAYNVAHGQGFTFSGLMPTNGFHPFWLLVCVPVAWISGTKPLLLANAMLLIALLNALTLLAMRDLLRRVSVPQPSAAVLFAAPYLFFVLIGMEGHLSALLLVLTLRAAHDLVREPGAENRLRTAVLGGLVVFSRLDLAILLAPLALWILLRDLARAPDWRARARDQSLALLVGATPVALFLLINALAFGTPVPISGLLKLRAAGVTAFSINGIALLYLAVALAGAVAAALPPRDDFGRIHIALTTGLLAFLTYLVFSMSEACSWYYDTCAVVAMSGAGLVLRRSSQLAAARGGRLPRRAVQVLAAGVALFGVASMFRYGMPSGPPRPPPFEHGEASLGARAAGASIRRVFAFDRPGELAFYHGLSVLAADGLTTNLPFQRELSERGIQWALERFRIQAIVVPRLGEIYGDEMCGRMYLACLRFVCDDGESPQISRLEVFSRLDRSPLGSLDLSGRPRLDFRPDEDLVVVLLDGGRGNHNP